MHNILFEPSKSLWQVWGLILLVISPLLPSCCSFSFALGHGISFFGGIQHSPVDGCSAVSCNYGVLLGKDEHPSSYSAILPEQDILHRYITGQICDFATCHFVTIVQLLSQVYYLRNERTNQAECFSFLLSFKCCFIQDPTLGLQPSDFLL